MTESIDDDEEEKTQRKQTKKSLRPKPTLTSIMNSMLNILGADWELFQCNKTYKIGARYRRMQSHHEKVLPISPITNEQLREIKQLLSPFQLNVHYKRMKGDDSHVLLLFHQPITDTIIV